MLTLPQNWRSILAGATVSHILAELPGTALRDQAASHLIGASLDLLVATWPRRVHPPTRVEMLSGFTWRISRLYYAYLPADDDSAFADCLRLARSSEVTAILPPRHEALKRGLLSSALGERPPSTEASSSRIRRATSGCLPKR